MTVIFESNREIKNNFVIKNNKITFRVVGNEKLKSILHKFNFPLALTTTNISNTKNCFTEQQVYSQIGTRINYIYC